MREIFKKGNPYIWLTASALTVCLLMICGVIVLIMMNGFGIFWPRKIVKITLHNGTVALGEIVKKEPIPYQKDSYRTKIKIGNRDVYGSDFTWIANADMVSLHFPIDAVVFERREWGNLYGFLKGFRQGETIKPLQHDTITFLLAESRNLYKKIRYIEKKEIGNINYLMEKYRLELKRLMMFPPTEKNSQKDGGA